MAAPGSTRIDVCTSEVVNKNSKVPDLTMLRTSKSEAWPLPNVWLGTSTEDQPAADERIPWLLRCPAPVHFLSIEPQCGPVDLENMVTKIPGGGEHHWNALECDVDSDDDGDWHGATVNWVIDGGWSGPGAGPFDLAWTRSTQSQCKAAGVAYYRKQLGARPVEQHALGGLRHLSLNDSHGGDEAEWPADLRGARAFPRPS